MGSAAPKLEMMPAEYLASERASEERLVLASLGCEIPIERIHLKVSPPT